MHYGAVIDDKNATAMVIPSRLAFRAEYGDFPPTIGIAVVLTFSDLRISEDEDDLVKSGGVASVVLGSSSDG